jgi:hypothetical protein
MQQHHCQRQHAACTEPCNLSLPHYAAKRILTVTASHQPAARTQKLAGCNVAHNSCCSCMHTGAALLTLQSLARGKEALLAPKSPLSVVKADTPEQQQQAAAPKPQQQQQSLLASLAMSARRLLRQGTWVGTDVPAFNGASMGWYQGERLQGTKLMPTSSCCLGACTAYGRMETLHLISQQTSRRDCHAALCLIMRCVKHINPSQRSSS